MEANDTSQSSSFISRIPWKEYLRSILTKVIAIIVIAILFILILVYSREISSNVDELNPPNVIGFDSIEYLILIVLSSLLFIFILGSFVKTLFIDHQDEFGIDNLRSRKSLTLLLLVVSFIASIYVLLDVALKNIYMTTGPVDALWIIDNRIGFDIPTIDASTDRLAYARIRTYYFFFFYVVMFTFPVIMFFLILTRFGRNRLFKRDETEQSRKRALNDIDSKAFNAMGILFAPILILFLLSVLLNPGTSGFTSNMLTISILTIFIWWVYQVIKLILHGVKLGAFLSYANLILFFPLLFLFYIMPAILWTAWDLLKIFTMNGSTLETIHTEMATPLANQVLDLANMSTDEFVNLVVQTLSVNAIAIPRIIQLDFVFVVGISAIAIGFAEGYAIISIFTALFKGASIARTGRIAKRSAPKMVVMASRLVMIGAWLSFFWDRITITIQILKEEFAVVFPWILDIKLPRIFGFLTELFDIAIDFGVIIVPLTPFVVALYYILMSSFKFLSVSLIVEKLKNDSHTYYLLISSAFVLIATNILQDITETVLNNSPSDKMFLPTSFASTALIIEFANKIFETLESFAFYAGVLFALVVFGKAFLGKIKKFLGRKKPESKYDAFFNSRLGEN